MKNYARLSVVMYIVGSGFFSIVSVQGQAPDVESFLKREMKELGIPGMQVAVVQQGKIVFNKSFGVANLQDNIPVTNKTIFAINSCTKAFTGVAIMQLVEEGKVDLLAPVSRYVDDLPCGLATDNGEAIADSYFRAPRYCPRF